MYHLLIQEESKVVSKKQLTLFVKTAAPLAAVLGVIPNVLYQSVQFQSSPSGFKVLDQDQQLVCGATPCEGVTQWRLDGKYLFQHPAIPKCLVSQKKEGSLISLDFSKYLQSPQYLSGMSPIKSDGFYEANANTNIITPLFWIDKHEVTVGEYKECVEAGICPSQDLSFDNKLCNWGKTDRSKHPINCVSQYEAKTFCEFKCKSLPTQEQWLKSARSRDYGNYSWGSRGIVELADDNIRCANIADKSMERSHLKQAIRKMARSPVGTMSYTDGYATTSPVGHYNAPKCQSPNQVADIIGNISEWTSTQVGELFVITGSSWANLS